MLHLRRRAWYTVGQAAAVVPEKQMLGITQSKSNAMAVNLKEQIRRNGRVQESTEQTKLI